MSAPLIKICGTTSLVDTRLAEADGANLLGVIIDHSPSPRSVDIETARAIFAATKLPGVAVTVNRTAAELLRLREATGAAILQLHGDEPTATIRELVTHGCRVWAVCSGDREATRKRAEGALEAGAEALLIDARHESEGTTVYGGTGIRADWELARELVDEGARVVLAGGLDAANVREAIEAVHPWAVDVVSGVEARKGIKDAGKLAAFVEAVQANLRHRR